MAKQRTREDDKLLDSALALIETDGFAALSFSALARHAGVSLAAIYEAFPSKSALLSALFRRSDLAVLGAAPAWDTMDTARDRLFDLLMARFEELGPWRGAVRVIYRDLRRMPIEAVAALPALMRSMLWTAELAGLKTAGFEGALRVRALAGVYSSVLPVWLGDEDRGLALTMAALDRRLRHTGRLWQGALEEAVGGTAHGPATTRARAPRSTTKARQPKAKKRASGVKPARARARK